MFGRNRNKNGSNNGTTITAPAPVAPAPAPVAPAPAPSREATARLDKAAEQVIEARAKLNELSLILSPAADQAWVKSRTPAEHYERVNRASVAIGEIDILLRRALNATQEETLAPPPFNYYNPWGE